MKNQNSSMIFSSMSRHSCMFLSQTVIRTLKQFQINQQVVEANFYGGGFRLMRQSNT